VGAFFGAVGSSATAGLLSYWCNCYEDEDEDEEDED
jgi:hypothetical protein